MAQNRLSWGDKLPFGCVLAPIRFGACILWQLVPTGVFTRQSVALGVYCPDPKYKRTADSLVKFASFVASVGNTLSILLPKEATVMPSNDYRLSACVRLHLKHSGALPTGS